MNEIHTLKKLSEIYDKYDVFILDQWGVMHDGQRAYNEAIDCVNKLYELDKKLIIISNSSQRRDFAIQKLIALGYKKRHFLEVLTSGEMIWKSLFSKKNKKIKNLGKNCFYIHDETKQNSLNYTKGLNYNFVKDIENADFILGCTPLPNFKTIDYLPILKKAIEKNLIFVCANPDFESIDSTNEQTICMGTIAELYKDFGGEVFILGKPNIEIYIEATKRIENIKKSKFICIGDSIFHDIQGANIFGIDSILITSGIHKSSFDHLHPKWDTELNQLLKMDINPTYLSRQLKF